MFRVADQSSVSACTGFAVANSAAKASSNAAPEQRAPAPRRVRTRVRPSRLPRSPRGGNSPGLPPRPVCSPASSEPVPSAATRRGRAGAGTAAPLDTGSERTLCGVAWRFGHSPAPPSPAAVRDGKASCPGIPVSRSAAMLSGMRAGASLPRSLSRCARRSVACRAECPVRRPIIGWFHPRANARGVTLWRQSWMHVSLAPGAAHARIAFSP